MVAVFAEAPVPGVTVTIPAGLTDQVTLVSAASLGAMVAVKVALCPTPTLLVVKSRVTPVTLLVKVALAELVTASLGMVKVAVLPVVVTATLAPELVVAVTVNPESA
jgi:hypothetical protein